MIAIDLLFEQSGFSLDEVSQKSTLSSERITAIITGRWTPSPEERAKLAGVFGVEVTEVVWGHSMDPRNIRYRQFGLVEDFNNPQG